MLHLFKHINVVGNVCISNLVIALCMLITVPALAHAEVYKWQDADGMHFTDNPSSVPEKYREKVYSETLKQDKVTVPPPRRAIPQLDIQPVLNQIKQVSQFQANLEQQRRAAGLVSQQQSKLLAANTRNLNKSFESLARSMAVWFIIGSIVFIAWISTIVDIVRSDFTSPSNKTVWVLLVILLPLLGMLLYYIFGSSQKINRMSYRDRQQEESLARLRPRDPKDKDFVI